jgi:hypothetical protein
VQGQAFGGGGRTAQARILKRGQFDTFAQALRLGGGLLQEPQGLFAALAQAVFALYGVLTEGVDLGLQFLIINGHVVP